MTNLSNEGKESKRSFYDKFSESRFLVSLILVGLLIPFITLTGGLLETNSKAFDITFIIFVGIILIMLFLEITLFFIDFKTEKRKFFYFLSLSLITMFSIYVITLTNYYMSSYGKGGFIEIRQICSLIFISSIIFLLTSTFLDSELKVSFTLFVIYLFSTLFLISVVTSNFNFGFLYTFWVVGIIIIGDICAYFGGKFFGRNKLTKISPNKTIEGYLIGLSMAIAFGITYYFAFISNFDEYIFNEFVTFTSSLWASITLVIIIALIAPIGDLFFSKIKRGENKKNFSKILLGHGGLLDRTDSHIFSFTFAASFIYFCTFFII